MDCNKCVHGEVCIGLLADRGLPEKTHPEHCRLFKPKAEWISVKDRLPESGVDVLCWYSYFRYGRYNRMYQTYGIGVCFNGNWCGEVSVGRNCRVIAWMPLPEPPKGE